MSERSVEKDAGWTCDCGRAPVVVFVGRTQSSLIVRRFRDVPHCTESDGKCADCVADLAVEIGAFVRSTEQPIAMEAADE